MIDLTVKTAKKHINTKVHTLKLGVRVGDCFSSKSLLEASDFLRKNGYSE